MQGKKNLDGTVAMSPHPVPTRFLYHVLASSCNGAYTVHPAPHFNRVPAEEKKGILAVMIFVGHPPRIADSRLRDPQERAGNDAQSGRRQQREVVFPGFVLSIHSRPREPRLSQVRVTALVMWSDVVH